MTKLGLGAVLGAIGAWFLDPQAGKRRRHITRDKTLAFFRRGPRRGAPAHPPGPGRADGVVQLRGELPSQTLIDSLVRRTREIQGVQDVESLLHTTGTKAPMHS